MSDAMISFINNLPFMNVGNGLCAVPRMKDRGKGNGTQAVPYRSNYNCFK